MGRLTTRPAATVMLVRSFGSPGPPSSFPSPSFVVSTFLIVCAVDWVRKKIVQAVFTVSPKAEDHEPSSSWLDRMKPRP
jgi:hypothetical protein